MLESMKQDETGAAPIPFAQGFVMSDAFRGLFREGMVLVEDTAAYLDGDGRAESAALGRDASLTYATESMRLTTRLMQIASWLLVQRAVAEGEMSPDQARSEKNRVRIADAGLQAAPEVFEKLPSRLRELIDHSQRLQARIRRLEDQISGAAPAFLDNPVLSQLQALTDRFSRGF